MSLNNVISDGNLNNFGKTEKKYEEVVHGSTLSNTRDKPHMQQQICHGKVYDLEPMVPKAWWKTVFADVMYLKTDGDVIEDPEITTEEIHLLESDPLIQSMLNSNSQNTSENQCKILDLCCGQGRHSLHLAKKYPHLKICGHDQSSFLISVAKERAILQKSVDQTTFTVGDCRKIPYPNNSFNLVIVMGNSFGYFSNDNGDKDVLKEINRVLSPGGRVVLDLTDGGYMKENFSERSWEWVDDKTFVCRERQLSKDKLRLISREIITETERGVIRDQFYHERLYSREELKELILEAGMAVDDTKSLNESDPVITIGKDLSKRNEDLGMMEQRMIFMAQKLDSSTLNVSKSGSISSDGTFIESPIQSSAAVQDLAFTDMVILLGDPSIPCIGKLNDSWNKEDIETRKKLKDAISEIGYKSNNVTFLDSHQSLSNILALKKPSFVFNLCDEGYMNDPLKELHIPALLDILNIEYSGAGSACLAFCFDKGLVNRNAEALGVYTPKEAIFLGANDPKKIQEIENAIQESIKYPAFIKPVKGDNSFGITTRSIVKSKSDLEQYMKELASIGIYDVLIQEYLQGTEYGVGAIGNPETGLHFLPIIEVDYSQIISKSLPPILGFESKWDPKSPYWTDIKYKKAELAPEIETQLKNNCRVLWERLGCRDYARFDFRSDNGRGDGMDGMEGKIKLLEVNPNPGWCWDGKLAYMGKLEGMNYAEMIRMILEAAKARL